MGAVVRILTLLSFITVTFAYKNLRVRSDSSITGRIVGGHAGRIVDFPFMVKLTISISFWEEAICGGSYIQKWWVLTAAHCLDINDSDDSYPPEVGDESRVKCLMGMENQYNTVYQRRKSKHLYINPLYFRNATEVFNDIGLIMLKRPFKLTASVQMIPIPPDTIDYGGQTVTLLGWGATKKSDRPSEGIFTAPNNLQVLDTIAHGMEECENVTGSPTVICIGEEGSVSCSGDSGGPLIFDDMLIGVCSYGFGCAGQFAVYENVYSHREWINDTMNQKQRQSMLYESKSAESPPGKLLRFFFCFVVLIACPVILN